MGVRPSYPFLPKPVAELLLEQDGVEELAEKHLRDDGHACASGKAGGKNTANWPRGTTTFEDVTLAAA